TRAAPCGAVWRNATCCTSRSPRRRRRPGYDTQHGGFVEPPNGNTSPRRRAHPGPPLRCPRPAAPRPPLGGILTQQKRQTITSRGPRRPLPLCSERLATLALCHGNRFLVLQRAKRAERRTGTGQGPNARAWEDVLVATLQGVGGYSGAQLG